MKRFWMIVACVLLCAVWAVAQAEQKMDGATLWKQISKTTPYKDWGQFPDHQGMQDGKAPHGPKHIVYVNKPGLTKGHPKPDGTIIVKENYTADEKLAALTVMAKVKGYNPEAGDWFWVKYAPDGTVQKEGKPKGCISCHSVRAEMDYIMVSDF